VAGRRGTQIATTALARLLLTKVWNIMLTGKEYAGRPLKKVTYKLKKVQDRDYDAKETFEILSSASASSLANG
jgi:hypothetical protein